MRKRVLYTEEGEKTRQIAVPLEEYPRPSMVRESYYCLNGTWEFGHGGERTVFSTPLSIRVPYPPQSPLAAVGEAVPVGDTLFYRRCFSLPAEFGRGRVLLHFGAADQIARVILNGWELGKHEGGYEAFSFDITERLLPENELCVVVWEEEGTRLPYGKQRGKRGGMWYTPVSGLWQTVWLESVPECYIRDVRVMADLEGATVTVEGEEEGTVTLEDGRTFPLREGRAYLPMPEGEYWTPENPRLYRFTVRAGEDSVSSYFALRTVRAGKDKRGKRRLYLNGKPYYFHGLLDQGYYPDGILTPPSYESYRQDILAAKEMGFNLLRKHIKVECERFYYECDRLGMAVLQDAVNNADYSFLRDTALPTLGFRKKDDRRAHSSPEGRRAFLAGLEAMVKRASRFPSVVGYTVFNEGWGQFDHAAVYQEMKRWDPTRFVDSVSGWFSPKKAEALASDVISEHVYFKPVRLSAGSKPLLLSEFGGYTLSLPDHVFSPGKEYGYRRHKNGEELMENLTKLYLDEILPAIEEGLCLSVYTQLSDVEDETNGLLTYDRRVRKVSAEKMREIALRLSAAHREATE